LDVEMEPSLRSPKIAPATYARPSVAPGKMPSGRLVLFSAAERRFCEPLLRGFKQRHPDVELDFVFGLSTDLHRRYFEELRSGGPSASLLWSSAMDLQMRLVLDGHAQPHGVRHTLRPQDAYRDLALATTCEPLFTLSRDPSVIAGTPGEITALIMKDPDRLRGRIAIPDIESNGLGFLAMLRWSLQEPEFDAFLDALKCCAPCTVGSAPALVRAVADGAELALHVLGAYALQATDTYPMFHIAPSAALPLAVTRVAFIPRRAPNPDAACAFLAYMLSPQGQAAMGEGGLIPITAPLMRTVAPIPLDNSFARLIDPATRAALLMRWRAMLGRPTHSTGGSAP
jgi:iron(III) transport system substrate-binding protein